MSNKKLTKKDYFNQLRNLVTDNESLTAFIDHEIELLDRKNAKAKSGEKKLSESQKANIELADRIYDCMESGKGYTISEMIKSFGLLDGEGAPLSTSKVSAVVRINMLGTLVTREEIKGKAYFTKVEKGE